MIMDTLPNNDQMNRTNMRWRDVEKVLCHSKIRISVAPVAFLFEVVDGWMDGCEKKFSRLLFPTHTRSHMTNFSFAQAASCFCCITVSPIRPNVPPQFRKAKLFMSNHPWIKKTAKACKMALIILKPVS